MSGKVKTSNLKSWSRFYNPKYELDELAGFYDIMEKAAVNMLKAEKQYKKMFTSPKRKEQLARVIIQEAETIQDAAELSRDMLRLLDGKATMRRREIRKWL